MTDVRPFCQCGHVASIFTVTSQDSSNLGKKFYCCPKNKDDRSKCKFFCWQQTYLDSMNAVTPSRVVTSNKNTASSEIDDLKREVSECKKMLVDLAQSQKFILDYLNQTQYKKRPLSGSTQDVDVMQ